MLEHVKGCIHIDRLHVIIYGGPREPTIEMLRQLCHRAFPKLVGPKDWIWGSKPTNENELHQKGVPRLFTRIIKEEDTKNDWKSFPYVAIESRGGIIKSTPLSVE